MLCPNCNKQIPDDSERCGYCDHAIDHKEQVPKEIGQRRKQRWLFYVVFVLLFIVAVGTVIYVMDKNSKLLIEIADIEKDLRASKKTAEEKERELAVSREELAKKENALKNIEGTLNSKVKELEDKTNEFRRVFEEKSLIDEKYDECNIELDSSEANIYNLIVKLGIGMSDENISKIMIADANFDGMDSDNDGLPDIIEDLIGTNPNLGDSDGDGYSDKEEVLKGFNPNGEGELNIDWDFANRQKGNILLQVEQGGEAWYVSPGDGKRYFLGRPIDGFKIMRNLDYWNNINRDKD